MADALGVRGGASAGARAAGSGSEGDGRRPPIAKAGNEKDERAAVLLGTCGAGGACAFAVTNAVMKRPPPSTCPT